MFTQRKHDATVTEVQCEIVSLNLVALFQGLLTVHLLLSCSPRPSHHPVFECLQQYHLLYQGAVTYMSPVEQGCISIVYNTVQDQTLYSEKACRGKSSVHLSEPWQTHEAAIHPCTGHSCLFSAWLTIHAVNYVVKLFLFVPNEKHTLINLVWPN